MLNITIIILITTKEILLQLVHDKKLTDNICVDNTTYNADAGIITYGDDGWIYLLYRKNFIPRYSYCEISTEHIDAEL